MAKKQYKHPKSYVDTTACPSSLEDKQYEDFFKDLCNCRGVKDKLSPPVSDLNEDAIWNGRSLWIFITEVVLNNELDEFETRIENNSATLTSLRRMPSKMPGSELVEIGICCAVEVSDDLTLQAFLTEYIKYSVEKGWYKWIETFKYHQELLSEHFPAIEGDAPANFDLEGIQPRLSIPEARPNNDNYFANERLEIIGRDQEQKKLRLFLESDSKKPKLQWFQLAGLAGMGKSRLALDLVLYALRSACPKWQAGFLTERDLAFFKKKWAYWQPNMATLLVFDYVAGREEKIKSIFDALLVRKTELNYDVRILLIERQPWNKNEHAYLGEKTKKPNKERKNSAYEEANWFINIFSDDISSFIKELAFENGIEELRPLNKSDLISLVEQSAGKELTIPRSDITKVLERIDDSGRALYAYLLGQEFIYGSQEYEKWTHIDLLDKVVFRELKKRCEPLLGNNPPIFRDRRRSMKLALLSTIVRSVDVTHKVILQYLGHVSSKDIAEATVINNSLSINKYDCHTIIYALEPDLFGEYFVLTAFEKGIECQEILNIAWCYSPEKTADFLCRITDNFADHSALRQVFHAYPKDESKFAIFGEVFCDFIYSLYHRNFLPQADFFPILELVVKRGNARAMNTLSFCYFHGFLVQANLYSYFYWTMQSAKNGDADAMYEIACDFASITTESDRIALIASSANKGHSRAIITAKMNNIEPKEYKVSALFNGIEKADYYRWLVDSILIDSKYAGGIDDDSLFKELDIAISFLETVKRKLL